MTEDRLSPLRTIVGSANVLVGPDDTAGYTEDWRKRFNGAALAVVRPGTTAEVADVMRWADETRTPVVPQGGNTGLNGGSVPLGGGEEIVVSLSRLNRVRDLDLAANTVTVEAGCVLATVQRLAADNDRLFPMGLGSDGSCQIGGNLSTNAGGTEVLRFGPMRDLVLGLEVVLPDGAVMNGLHKLRKNNTGYDLKHMFIGAEGTLGIITAAVLKLFPRPRVIATAFCGIADPADALRLFARVNDLCGHRLGAFEIISEGQMALVQRHADLVSPLASRHPWYLLVELSDPDPETPYMTSWSVCWPPPWTMAPSPTR
jgi:FAD/FMN-containing dehydrogenase